MREAGRRKGQPVRWRWIVGVAAAVRRGAGRHFAGWTIAGNSYGRTFSLTTGKVVRIVFWTRAEGGLSLRAAKNLRGNVGRFRAIQPARFDHLPQGEESPVLSS